MRTVASVFITGVLLFIPQAPVLGAVITSGEQVTFGVAERIEENIYVAGGQVSLLGEALKDVIAAGGRIVVNGPVGGDLTLAGGTVDVFERTDGDVRVVGGEVTLAKPVAGDVVVVGGAVTILPGATILGDVLIAGGSVTLQGEVGGDVRVAAGDFLLDSVVAGNVDAQVSDRVRVGDSARVAGAFSYASPLDAEVANGAIIQGGVTRTTTAHESPVTFETFLFGAGILFFILAFLIYLTAALLFRFLFPHLTRILSDAALDAPLKHLGLGLVGFVVMPVAIILLFVSVIGALIGGLVLFVFVFFALLAQVVAGIILGAYLARFMKKEDVSSWRFVVAGTGILYLISFVPFIGWLVSLVVYLLSFGVILMVGYHFFKEETYA